MSEDLEGLERVNVMRVVSYDVEHVLEELKRTTTEVITLDDVMTLIEDWAEREFGCDSCGHKQRVGDLIFQDQDGEDL
jgi:hypothetical protein